MTYALIWLSGGIIEQVTFFESKLQAVKTLADFVKGMDLHDDDAAVFGPEGLVANAKDLLEILGGRTDVGHFIRFVLVIPLADRKFFDLFEEICTIDRLEILF